jgi:hypothetical protein
MASTGDKARKAREKASNQNFKFPYSSSSTDNIVMDLTRGKAKGLEKVTSRFPDAAESRAAAVVQQRRRIDTGKTAARAAAIVKRTEKKAAQKTTRAGVSGVAKKREIKPTAATAKFNAATKAAKKPAPKKK